MSVNNVTVMKEANQNIGLNSCKDQVITLHRGEEAYLTICTLDASYEWKLVYVR